MRLYFAGNSLSASRGGTASAQRAGVNDARAGIRNRLLSYAELDGNQHGAWDFWVVQRMRLFFAGNVKPSRGDDAHRVCHADGVSNRLLTFADMDDWAKEGFAFWVGENPASAHVFLDSGAFGAYMRGAVIDLGRYCDYVNEHREALGCYAALDVIGDWQRTRANYDEMVSRGLDPIPTWHRGSPWHALEKYAAEHPSYLALGGLAADTSRPGARPSTSRDNIEPFLDEVFRRLARFWPVRVHAFGMVSQWALEKYPFYSADSATAIVGAGMGRVSRFRDGRAQSRPWVEDVRRTWDGVVADNVGRADGSAHAGRRRRNIEAQLALERYVTDLWAARGVTWES